MIHVPLWLNGKLLNISKKKQILVISEYHILLLACFRFLDLFIFDVQFLFFMR
jgi:hypothetical protein